VVEDFNSGFSK